MRSLYKNQYVDYNDGNTEFVQEFNSQIADTGALVYNYSSNTYQFITRFEDCEFINELDPWYFKVDVSSLPKGIDVTMTYAFDPEDYSDDQEISQLWQQAVEEGSPYYDYQQDGEIYLKEIRNLTNQPTKHTIWILDSHAKEIINEYDRLLILPMIKYLDIAKNLILNNAIEPFDE